MSTLSQRQVEVLVAIYDRQHNGLPLMHAALIADDINAPRGGVNQTTGSLVRRGCLTREHRGGHVVYRLTERGEAVAAPAWRAVGG